MTPETFSAKTREVLAKCDHAHFDHIGGPNLIGHPDFQAALYGGVNPVNLKPRQMLFVAHADPKSTYFDSCFLFEVSVVPTEEGYVIGRKHNIEAIHSLGEITISYPT